ncbi:MAG TPA: Ig-like domain-containing protein [Acidimicrobiales bacterium]|nr:Ig-like domain-containing protein [Acidimicrobiales bacterium]
MRKRLAALMAAALSGLSLAIIAAPPAAATLPAPVILNNGAQNGGNAQWMESQSQPDDGGTSVKQFVATFLVQHAVGRTINNVRIDADFNGTDNASSGTLVPVTEQAYVASAGGMETSRVTVAIPIGKPGGFGCTLFGNTIRRVDAPVRMRVQDSTNEQSATVSTTVHFVEDVQCGLVADFPSLNSTSQNLTEVTPGQNITYTFQCDDDDIDLFSTDDDCDRANIRWRRLNDGDTSGITLKTGIDDNTDTTQVMSFPSRGYYVVEAQLGNENGSFPDTGAPTGGWYRLGNAVVNDAASSLVAAMSFSGVSPSSPPSVNPGAAVNAQATVGDNGLNTLADEVQVIEWDADGDNAFERREYTIPSVVGGDIVHPTPSAAMVTQAVTTATPGLKQVNAKITDNGALDAADSIRRQLTFGAQLRVNAIPTASNVPVTTAEDTAATITMVGNDTDNQPDPLTYTIVSGVPAAAGTLSAVSGNQVTFTPALNFNGTTSFTYRVEDGTASTVGAHAPSNTATVNITVTAVNDNPTADPKSKTTNEDTPTTIQATGNDVEDATLTWTVNSPPAHGGATCTTSGLCTYSPALNFFGTDTFVVRGTDSGGLFATATFTITVNPVNDAPEANDDTVHVPEDSVNFPINLTASDVDSLVLTFTAPVDDVDHGSLTCIGQACTYTAAANYNGPDSFTFSVTDGALADVGTITIVVDPVNDAPVATDVLDAETNEDVPVDIATTGTDIDTGDTVSVTSVTDPPHGSATIISPALTTYLGDLNFNGIDTFDFTVSDGNGGTDDGTVVITVHPVNDAPVVNDQTFHVNEDTPALLSVVASDVDGDALQWSIVTPPTSGLLFGSGPDIGYLPGGNFNGTDTFVVQVDDGHGLPNSTDTAVITVIVDPVNDQPLANASSVTTDEDTSVNFSLDASDLDGDTLAITAPVLGPFNGNVVCAAALCEYMPNAEFHGSDLFTFSVDDGHGGTDNASVSITVNSVNDPPVSSGASATTPEDTSVAVTLPATDIDGDMLSYSTTSPAHGTLTGIAPNIVYVPNTNYFGADSFDFTADDNHGGQSSSTITITVTPVNDAPIATGGSVATPEDTSVSFQLGGTDVENDTLTYTVTSPPSVGTLTCNGTGACTYDPPADYSGSAIVRYDVTDGQYTDSGIFTVIVDPVNDPPVVNSSMTSTQEDVPLAITLSASDTEGDTLTYAIESPPSHGTITCSGGNNCTYTPAPNYNGGDAFNWSADDGHAGHMTATVSITVSPVNDAPQALDVSNTTDEEVPVAVPLLANDVDGDPITYTLVSGPSHGSLAISGATATYTPAVDFNGVDTFVYRATDPSGASTTATGTVTVIGLPLIGTYVQAQAATVYVELKVGVPTNARVALLQLAATLRSAATGATLPGRLIDFTIGTRYICSAYTNANGFATCGTRSDGLVATLNLGYRAAFSGDADYSGSAATAPLIAVNVVRLP